LLESRGRSTNGPCQDGRDVVGLDDGVGEFFRHARALGDDRRGALGEFAPDDLDQVVVGEQRRELQHRGGDGEFGVARELFDEVRRRVGDVLQGLGDHAAHARGGVLGEHLQRLHDALACGVLFAGLEVGQDTLDLAREARAHVHARIAGELHVGLPGQGRIVGERLAHLRRDVVGEVIEQLGAQIGALGHIRPDVDVRVVQHAFGGFVFGRVHGGAINGWADGRAGRAGRRRRCLCLCV
jgi:hypothetical protein